MAKPSVDELWLDYLRAHSQPRTRHIHYAATLIAVLGVVAAIVWWKTRLAILGFGLSYAFAWLAHYFIEDNKPAAFTRPLWSLIFDFRMTYEWIVGGLEPHLKRAGVSGVTAKVAGRA